MDHWGSKHVEPPSVMNKLNHKTLCILFDYIYIARWYTVPTVSSSFHTFLYSTFVPHWQKGHRLIATFVYILTWLQRRNSWNICIFKRTQSMRWNSGSFSVCNLSPSIIHTIALRVCLGVTVRYSCFKGKNLSNGRTRKVCPAGHLT